MFRNQQPPSPDTIEYRKRIRSRRPRTPLLALQFAHRYVGVSRQAVSARVRAHKLATELGDGYPWSRYSRVRLAHLNAWIARREAHLDPVACGRRPPKKTRTRRGQKRPRSRSGKS